MIILVLMMFLFLGTAYGSWSEASNIANFANTKDLAIVLSTDEKSMDKDGAITTIITQLNQDTLNISSKNVYPGYEENIVFYIENSSVSDGYLTLDDFYERMPNNLNYRLSASFDNEDSIRIDRNEVYSLSEIREEFHKLKIPSGEKIKLSLWLKYPEESSELKMKEQTVYAYTLSFKLSQSN